MAPQVNVTVPSGQTNVWGGGFEHTGLQAPIIISTTFPTSGSKQEPGALRRDHTQDIAEPRQGLRSTCLCGFCPPGRAAAPAREALDRPIHQGRNCVDVCRKAPLVAGMSGGPSAPGPLPPSSPQRSDTEKGSGTRGHVVLGCCHGNAFHKHSRSTAASRQRCERTALSHPGAGARQGHGDGRP